MAKKRKDGGLSEAARCSWRSDCLSRSRPGLVLAGVALLALVMGACKVTVPPETRSVDTPAITHSVDVPLSGAYVCDPMFQMCTGAQVAAPALVAVTVPAATQSVTTPSGTVCALDAECGTGADADFGSASTDVPVPDVQLGQAPAVCVRVLSPAGQPPTCIGADPTR